jgi:hypothetical protein
MLPTFRYSPRCPKDPSHRTSEWYTREFVLWQIEQDLEINFRCGVCKTEWTASESERSELASKANKP